MEEEGRGQGGGRKDGQAEIASVLLLTSAATSAGYSEVDRPHHHHHHHRCTGIFILNYSKSATSTPISLVLGITDIPQMGVCGNCRVRSDVEGESGA